MRINPQLMEKIQESLSSVLPITAIVLLLCITIAPVQPGTLVLFLFGAVLLIIGIGLFTLGADIAMTPMGSGMGVHMGRSRSMVAALGAAFLLGVIITVAEPDLQVLANQVPSIPNLVLILTVAVGVGLFLLVAVLRTRRKVRLARLLLVFYGLVFLVAFLAPKDFIAVSFDSGGVTTGPITVPFIMALGVGMASVRSDKGATDDSFGLVALCSIGPVLAVLLLGTFYRPEEAAYVSAEVAQVLTTRDAAVEFLHALPHYAQEVGVALLPICGMFVVFQLFTRRFKGTELLKVISGLVYTYVGLVIFLTGVNVGFLPAGQFLGATLAGGAAPWLLVPVGMVMGYFIVAAEPAVHVLNKQVEEVSMGAVSQKAMRLGLSVGVALSVGIAMLRVLTGVSILWILVPGYAISLALTFFVPPMYTGIAFDSGGVASGPMTATFLLPFAMGACEALGGNVMTDAFGLVAMVAMTPLVTIQVLGLSSQLRKKLARRHIQLRVERVDDGILYYDT